MLLKPHTGRRHQLRVHTLCLGHPIVGDFTYNPVQRDAVLLEQEELQQKQMQQQRMEEEKVVEGKEEECDSTVADRMMLHAHRLK